MYFDYYKQTKIIRTSIVLIYYNITSPPAMKFIDRGGYQFKTAQK